MSFHCKHLLELKSVRKLSVFFFQKKICTSTFCHYVFYTKEQIHKIYHSQFLTKVNLELSPREEIAVLAPSLNMIPNIVKTFSNVFVVNNKKHKYNNM